jgi:methionyl-tRNA synthetase
MKSGRPFYVTTPIYYVNDYPHIGHVYTTVVADVVARYRRLRGDDVRFVTGTDEHGVNIQRAADKLGIAPIELADRVVERYHSLWKQLGITHDDFIRTTEKRHAAGVSKLWRKVRDRGDIYEGSYEGWYCASCEAFYPEGQLVSGNCPVHERKAEWLEEPSYFFRLSKYQEPLLELYRSHPEFIRPESRRNEIVSFVESGLRDLSVSRATLKWGIPVPDAPGHVVYVWFDALTNYITSLGYGSPGDGAGDSPYSRYWLGGDAIHLVGKDILRFHAVYWPAFLLAAGEPLPAGIFAHGWWLLGDRKMSKSTGNLIRPAPRLSVVGVEAFRYFLMREMTFGLDGSYSDEALLERVNADLANNLGNLLSRVTTLLSKLPGNRPALAPGKNAIDAAGTLRADVVQAEALYLAAFDRFDFSSGLAAVWALLDRVNRDLVERKPWKLSDDAAGHDEAASILHEAAAVLRLVAVWISPVVPALSTEIWRQLGIDRDPGTAGLDSAKWDLPSASPPRTGRSLFARIDRKEALARIESIVLSEEGPAKAMEENKPNSAPAETPAAPEKPAEEAAKASRITIDQFMQVELRVARVESAERVPKANRLLRLVVDIGTEKRQIVAGIAEAYAPEDLVGKQIVIVANLEPAVLRGVESQGMLLAADSGGKPTVATFEAPVAPGTRVR